MYQVGKKERIKSEKEISSLFKCGKQEKKLYYSVIYKKNRNNFDRCAVIISRAHGSSVERNRLKRVYREVFRNIKIDNPPYYDILICPHIPSSVCSRLESEILREEYVTWRRTIKS